jgi:hypothetical protein
LTRGVLNGYWAVKVPVDVAVPPGVVTEIVPVFALVGDFTDTDVAVDEVGVAATPPKLTEVAPKRFVPVIVTTVPATPVVGVKLVIVGAAMKVKVAVLVAVPPGVVTEIVPVLAVVGTLTVTVEADTETGVAATPPKLTDVAPVR